MLKIQLEVTPLKLKIVFEMDLVQAREAGTLSQECFDFVWWLCRMWRGCTQEIEGLNGMLKMLIPRAPSVSLELASARICVRKALHVVGFLGPDATKWDVVKPHSDALLQDSVQYLPDAKTLDNQEDRCRCPGLADKFVPANKCAVQTKGDTSMATPEFEWACERCMIWSRLHAKLNFGQCLVQCMSFEDVAENVDVWVCATTRGHVGWFAKCRGVTPESFEIVLPLVFLSSVDVFRTRFGARHGPVFLHQVQWSLKPEHAPRGAITKDVTMDLKIKSQIPDAAKRRKTVGKQQSAGQGLESEAELACAFLEALRKTDEEDVQEVAPGIDVSEAPSEILDAADVRALQKKAKDDLGKLERSLANHMVQSDATAEEAAFHMLHSARQEANANEDGNVEAPEVHTDKAYLTWDTEQLKSFDALKAMMRGQHEQLGGPLGGNVSLVTRNHEACFVSWLSPVAALMGQRVNTDQADRFIAITPWRNPRTDFNAATVIWPNAGTRGDRRVDKTSRMPAPTHPMRVLKMMSVAFADGVTKDPCVRCGSFGDQAEASRRTSEDNPIRTCQVCLLTFHNACLEATKTYRDSVKSLQLPLILLCAR